jgi:hypothetical protein
MHMPIEIQEMPADTTVMGDIDAFIAYIESGQALNEWQKCHAKALQEIERCLRSNYRPGGTHCGQSGQCCWVGR